MLLSGGCVAVVIYLDDNVTVRWVCCRIIIFYSVCVCVCVCGSLENYRPKAIG